MPLFSMRQLLDHAAEYSYGLPAFNITNLETLNAVLTAAHRVESPVIIQASSSARKYIGDVMLKHMINGTVENWPTVPICMHLDHGSNPQVCSEAVHLGFSSVMMDGSLASDGKTPQDLQTNIAVTQKVVTYAHAHGVSVEGELGVLGSLETGRGEAEDGHGFEGTLDRSYLLTDPDDAVEFVRQTNVDALAIACGTSHGAYKFTRKPDAEILALGVIRTIHDRLPNCHLVMHGASTVPEDLQDLINNNGGQIKPTWGVPLSEAEMAILMGVRKINIDTDIRMAFTGAAREFLSTERASIDLRKMLEGGKQRTIDLCIERFEQFGSAGRSIGMKCITLEQMAQNYCGDLD